MSKKKVIFVGEFVKRIDGVVPFDVQDPDDPNEFVTVPIRIKRAKAKDSMKVMEYVSSKRSKGGFTDKELDDMSDEERSTAITIAYHYDALMISSTCFHVPEGFDIDSPNPALLKVDTPKIWETMDDVLNECPSALFDVLRGYVGQQRTVLTEAEAKK